MEAASKRLLASASNIANMRTVGSLKEGEQAPYTPLTTQNTTQTGQAGQALGVNSQFAPKGGEAFVPAYDPDSPFADENGYIGVPNVSLPEEAVNAKLASLTYRANLVTIEAETELAEELNRLFDDKV